MNPACQPSKYRAGYRTRAVKKKQYRAQPQTIGKQKYHWAWFLTVAVHYNAICYG